MIRWCALVFCGVRGAIVPHTHLLRPPAPLLALVLEKRLRHREDGREPDARAEEDDGAM